MVVSVMLLSQRTPERRRLLGEIVEESQSSRTGLHPCFLGA